MVDDLLRQTKRTEKGLGGSHTDIRDCDLRKNYHLLPLLFAYFVSWEFHEYWYTVLKAPKEIPCINVDSRTTIVHQQKSIDTAFKEVFEHSHMLIDPMYMKKNMGGKLGIEKETGLSLCMHAFYAQSTVEVDNIISQYRPVQKEYMSKFKNPQLYRAYSCI